MNTLEERFDKAEEIILKHSFRKNSGFEDSYYIFDYDPSKELYIRERIEFMLLVFIMKLILQQKI